MHKFNIYFRDTFLIKVLPPNDQALVLSRLLAEVVPGLKLLMYSSQANEGQIPERWRHEQLRLSRLGCPSRWSRTSLVCRTRLGLRASGSTKCDGATQYCLEDIYLIKNT